MDINFLELKKIFLLTITPIATRLGLKLIGVLAIWIIGRSCINWVTRILSSLFKGRQVDPTVSRYLTSAVSSTLTVVLVAAIAGFVGIEAVTFAALLAGVGLAIGTAWGDLLRNFAAGVFLMVLRPFKVGDMVTVAGRVGFIEELGIFVTKIHQFPDNTSAFIGNSKIFSDTIVNHTANDYRRAEVRVPLGYQVDPRPLLKTLRERLLKVPGVLTDPEPLVIVMEFTQSGYLIALMPCVRPADYYRILDETGFIVIDELAKHGFSRPALHSIIHPSTEVALPLSPQPPV